MKSETLEKLKTVSTATLATALYKRGLRNQMIQNVRPLSRKKTESMVGEAYTLRYMPAREDLNTLAVFRDHSHPQRKAVEDARPALSWSSTAERTPAPLPPAVSWFHA